MSTTDRPQSTIPLAAWAALLVGVLAASVVTVATVMDHRTSRASTCTVPSLAGTVVDVSLIDMNGGMMMNRTQSDWRTWHRGMMRIAVSVKSVQAGTVSLRVGNLGVVKHELVVLPLAAGQSIGSRTPGTDGQVDESASLGEASKSCGAGTGEGIEPRAYGWTTLTLQPGRYELLCNLPGHYAAGMYAELDVV